MFGFIVLFAHMFLYFVRELRFRVGTMNFYGRRFNTILTAIAALLLVAGCATGNQAGKELAVLRVHMESAANAAGSRHAVEVVRRQPVSVTIDDGPILTEANLIAARLIETPGGVAVEVKFDELGTLTLEQYSSSNPGKHFAIYGQWGEKLKDTRWLAAPIINRRIPNGLLSFTPDATRDEAKLLVLGLNNAAKKAGNAK